jgi:hypothetical protein
MNTKSLRFIEILLVGVTCAFLQVACNSQTALIEPTNTITVTSSRTITASETPVRTARYTVTQIPNEPVYVTVEEPMIVRKSPDTEGDIISHAPTGQTFRVLGRFSRWLLIDLGEDQTGWIYGAIGLTRLTRELTLVPTIDVALPRFVTPTPLCTPQNVQDTDQALNDAQSTLVTFFDLLSKKEYARAAEFYGGSFYMLRNSNPPVDPKDYATLFQHACEINGLQCLQIKQVVNRDVISQFRFEFEVEFELPDGSLFVLGPCCGGNETDQPPKSRFKYPVVLDCHNRYFVMELPVYVP